MKVLRPVVSARLKPSVVDSVADANPGVAEKGQLTIAPMAVVFFGLFQGEI
jgi:phage tail protein X